MSKENNVLEKLQQARALVDECIAELDGGNRREIAKTPSRSPQVKSAPVAHRDLDFDSNERAFVKAHARGLSGPKKFVLLLAYLAKGKVGAEVELKEVQKRWSKMTGSNLMGGAFNTFYSTTAKENGWIDTKKQGVYILRPSWTEVLKS